MFVVSYLLRVSLDACQVVTTCMCDLCCPGVLQQVCDDCPHYVVAVEGEALGHEARVLGAGEPVAAAVRHVR